jgi:hypothetical protein
MFLVMLASACATAEPPHQSRPSMQPEAITAPVVQRYSGPHPVNASAGGGWCYLDGIHEHDYLPAKRDWYRTEGGVLYLAAPIEVRYWDVHPDNLAGWCYAHGAHAHDYPPPERYRAAFQWDPARQHFAYRAPETERPEAPATH